MAPVSQFLLRKAAGFSNGPYCKTQRHKRWIQRMFGRRNRHGQNRPPTRTITPRMIFHIEFSMFRVDSRFEIHFPAIPQEKGAKAQQFHLVEQCFNDPLWHVQVLPRTSQQGFQRWCCYLVSRAGDALGILEGQNWEQAKVHVVLPEYMTQSGSIRMSRCTALWECSMGEEQQSAWQFDTPLGSFIDPEFGVFDIATVRKREIRWQDTHALFHPSEN